ncbi:glycerol-3-phosphate 1-O-acyltransferase PlsY [Desulfurobacterium atlanticum]|uniref:Glycerol-3-phosphate acyltransferase n=1 Tax=Desulfurobacterium atlanticum TaxID=240169 RepID=A0A238YVJ2_9BACT|nr:glycerol-3-phosphate 1-O-acyltransferase PlsY [Desulfurobacterium atlanticum]SNR75306.1 acyl-phosphate glycerol-3-phosphate acyltransferase [Desulfurobacterium atlanticum]
MDKSLLTVLIVVFSFLSGSIPFGYVIGKLKGVDVRKYGSGNIGATNVSRVLGKKIGLIVLILDALKGAIPVLTVKYAGLPLKFQLMAALFAVLGHCFSPFLGFKGGKGVATGIGAFAVISPVCAGIAVAVFMLVFFITRYVSLSSITAVASYVIAFKFLVSSSDIYIYVALAGFVIIVKHYKNIIRLIRGEEKKYGVKTVS